MKHELVVMSGLIDWDYLSDVFGRYFSEKGRPGVPTRIMAGLHILKHIHGLSDEEVCKQWRENRIDDVWSLFTCETKEESQERVSKVAHLVWSSDPRCPSKSLR